MVDFSDVQAAARLLVGRVHRTPVVTSHQLDANVGATLFLKCENLQRIGAFKIRGAMNAVLALDDATAARGVVTHSSGNHGQAVALAARERGIRAIVVMPRNTSRTKWNAVLGYGAEVVSCEPGTSARDAETQAVVARTGGTLIHPFEDPRVIAGQGTACLELLEEVPGLDIVLTPVGGGGLLSGTGVAAHGVDPRIAVHGAEPEIADDAARSFTEKRLVSIPSPSTIADGLRSSVIGALNLRLLLAHVAAIHTVGEAEIVAAMRFVWERLKLVIEPSSAVPIAAALRYGDVFRGKRIGIIISGGNVDLDHLPWLSPPPA